MYGTPDVFGRAIRPEQVKVAAGTRDRDATLDSARGFETPGIEIRTHDPLASRKKREKHGDTPATFERSYGAAASEAGIACAKVKVKRSRALPLARRDDCRWL